MTSTRLPQKPFRLVAGRELLGRVIDRVSAAQTMSKIIVATSTQPDDDALEAFCENEKVFCFRGSLNDVTARLLAAAVDSGTHAFIRISGDSPLIDPVLIDRVAQLYIDARPDIATNVFPKTFPAGQSVEAINTSALERLWQLQRDAPDAARLNEHVTVGFYQSPTLWNIINLESGLAGPHASMAVDTHEDLSRVEDLLRRAPEGPLGWRELVELSESV